MLFLVSYLLNFTYVSDFQLCNPGGNNISCPISVAIPNIP